MGSKSSLKESIERLISHHLPLSGTCPETHCYRAARLENGVTKHCRRLPYITSYEPVKVIKLKYSNVLLCIDNASVLKNLNQHPPNS